MVYTKFKKIENKTNSRYDSYQEIEINQQY